MYKVALAVPALGAPAPDGSVAWPRQVSPTQVPDVEPCTWRFLGCYCHPENWLCCREACYDIYGDIKARRTWCGWVSNCEDLPALPKGNRYIAI
jgi:hypothetical protein